MRLPLFTILLSIAPSVLVLSTGHAGELRIAAWNLEHFNDTVGEGCVPRTEADYTAIARQIAELDADVVAFQEVENEAAARRIFPADRWEIAFSNRPSTGSGTPCYGRPEGRLSHLGTGFAIRLGLRWRRHPDIQDLAAGSPFYRWGTDVTVTMDGRDLRLLSVHLASGCWGAGEDQDTRRSDTCTTLRTQFAALGTWVEERRNEDADFVLLGDFNRRLAIRSDWGWQALAPRTAQLRLLTAEIDTECDPRYTEFVDHLIASPAAAQMLVSGSIKEFRRQSSHPDHCAVAAQFVLE
ncbi:endonuclease/exonuclease/phosphatase family protein [Candidatus Rariloculus sp.]|uniref:endonuclease/exonuclease/phosphatase family protein n=1 Tax=Candidatus Rariloculus sp. TaxID=3101265 RepID=UPI003D0CE4F9